MTEGKEVRALFRTGRSTAVTVPPRYLEANKLKPRDRVEIIFSGALLLIRPVKACPIGEIVRKTEEALKEGAV